MFANTKPKDSTPRLEDLVQLFKFSADYETLRFLGPVTSFYQFWIQPNQKKRAFPKLCLDYNPVTEEMDKEICPYRSNELGRGQKVYLANAINRDMQKYAPKKLPPHTKSERIKHKDAAGNSVFYKERGSASWTPIQVVRLPSSLVEKLKGLKDLNNNYDITDKKYGIDVLLRKDPNSEGTQMYDVQRSNRTPLSKEERSYLRFKLEGLMVPEKLEQAKKEAKSIMDRMNSEEDEE